MNPSTDDLLKAVLATPAEHVYILPNNKNIIMAAEQVDPLTDRDVRVLHTKPFRRASPRCSTLTTHSPRRRIISR